MTDLPTFTASAYGTSSSRANLMAAWTGDSATWGGNPPPHQFSAYEAKLNIKQPESKKDMAVNGKATLRVVRVFLVDPDDRVPIDKRVLYRSDEITTDATDQELFFGIPVNSLLEIHNGYRATVQWEEKTSDGTKAKTGLKEARIRDLVMSVTTIAAFENRAQP